jgi:hypothetical protein
MPKTPWKSRWTILAIALAALFASACGAVAVPVAETTPSPASPSPSASPGGKTFNFKLNPAAAGVTAKGTITVTAGSKTTTVELKIAGLQANTSHISHIHIGSCAVRGGIAFALNQVVADGQGDANTRTTLDIKYPPAAGKWYVVVHAGPDMQGASASYLLCGNLF